MILGILAINQSNPFIALYSLQIICLIMILIHVTVRPYSNNVVNFFDSFMLLSLVLLITLQIIETYRGFATNITMGIAITLVILPLFVFLLIIVYLHVNDIKKLLTYCVSTIKLCKKVDTTNNEAVEMHHCEQEVIVNQDLRDKTATTIV